MNEPVELVIFDNDGVLVDSERLAAEMSVQIFAMFGMQLSYDEVIERFMGRTEGIIKQTIVEHLGHELSAEDLARIDSLRHTTFAERLEPIDGATLALGEIALPKCVASGGEPDSLRFKLERCDLLDFFDGHIFSAEQVEHGKPAPDLFLFAAKQMGVDPSRCVVVEDSVYGVTAARAAGMRTLAYLGGMVPAESLEGPDTTLFDSMHELPALIAELAGQKSPA
jgi:HAD superfamily hydrolase (TIGR01509 family)